MRRFLEKIAIFLTFLNLCHANVVIENALINVDISSQIVKCFYTLLVRNNGTASVNEIFFVANLPNDVYFDTSKAGDETFLQSRKTIHEGNVSGWTIFLPKALKGDKSTELTISVYHTKILKVSPKKISQVDNQIVDFTGSFVLFSPYVVTQQYVHFTLLGEILYVSPKLNRQGNNKNWHTYGPYYNMQPFTRVPIQLIYVNNLPFVVVAHYETTLEISNFHKSTVHSQYYLEHRGAGLKDGFSRTKPLPAWSVNELPIYLPPNAADISIFDAVGKIYSWKHDDENDFVSLTPRFPLLGGWKTSYDISYNVPTHELVKSNNTHFVVETSLFKEQLEDIVFEKVVSRIILPEGCQAVDIKAPLGAIFGKEHHYLALDTVGREAAVFRKAHVSGEHFERISIIYRCSTHERFLLKPLRVISALEVLLLTFIIGRRASAS